MRQIIVVTFALALAQIAMGDYTYIIGSGEFIMPGYLVNDESMLVQGGYGKLDLYNNSFVRIESTAPQDPGPGGIINISLYGHNSLEMIGGEVTNLVYVNGFSTATISGGFVSSLTNGGQTTISGGQVDAITNIGHLCLYGGDIEVITIDTYFNQVPWVDIFCKTYSAITQYDSTRWLVTGTWADDSPFSIFLKDNSGYYAPEFRNVRFTIVPEPITLAFLAFGGLAMRRYFRK